MTTKSNVINYLEIKQIENNNTKIKPEILKYDYIKLVKNVIEESKENQIDYSKYDQFYLSNSINYYLKHFPNDKEKLKNIQNELNENIKKLKKDIKQKHFTIDCFDAFLPNWLEQINNILKCKTESSAINYMRKIDLKENQYIKLISSFETMFSNSNEYIEKLEDIFNKYQEYIKKSKSLDEEKIKKMELKKEEYNFCVELLLNVLNTNSTIEEFCDITEYNIKEVKDAIRIVYGNRLEKKEFLEIVDSRINTNFINKLIDLKDNLENGNYDLLDYQLKTKLSFYDFITTLKKFNIDYEKMNYLLNNSYGTFGKSNILMKTKTNLEKELNNITIIKGKIVSKEEITKVFAFLEKHNIETNIYNYKLALNKYLNGELYLEQEKKKVK